jgi:hypothetical protein
MNKEEHLVAYSETDIFEQNKDVKLSKSLLRLLNKLAIQGCTKMVFSRFPYYTTKMQCKRLAKTTKEGNCVAFAYFMKDLLKQYKLDAFIVGAKVPPKFARPGYREICHAAVVLPYSTGIVLFDTAFYFNRAIVLDRKTDYQCCHIFRNVYSTRIDTWCFKLINETIHVTINNVDVDAYYQVREVLNPYHSITVPTNHADPGVFRCEVNKQLISQFYYKLNLRDHVLSISSDGQKAIQKNMQDFQDMKTGKIDLIKWKAWVTDLHLTRGQKARLYKDVSLLMSKRK